MKWAETIKVQAASGLESRTEEELGALVKDVLNNSGFLGLLEIELHNHASIPGCFTIQLTWDTETPKMQGSLLGLRLTETVKSFGMVDHSVWIGKE